MPGTREYEVRAASTATFGRVLVDARDQHLVVDGPVQNGCPGEAPTPAELFLAGVAACGVELVHVIAREHGIGLDDVRVTVRGVMDPARRPRPDVALFNAVALEFVLRGVGDEDAALLVTTFKGR